MPSALPILLATLLLATASEQPEPPPAPQPATIHAVSFAPRAGTTTLLLDSGLQVHIKPFTTPGMRIAVLIAGPEFLESPTQLGLTRLVASSLDLSTFPGWSAQLWPEGISLQHTTSTTPLTQTLSTLATIIKSPRLDPARFAKAKAELLTASRATADAKPNSAAQAIGAIFDPINQARAERLTPELVQAITIEAAQAFADARLSSSAIDIAIVGRIQPAEAIPVIQSALANISPRPRDRFDAPRNLPRPTPAAHHAHNPGPADQAYIVLTLPAPPQHDLTQARLSVLASKLMQAELTSAITEQGLKQLIVAGNAIPGRALPNMGLCIATAVVHADAAQAEKLIAATRERLTRLVTQGPTQASFDRARQDLLDELTPRLATADYWVTALPVAWFLNVPIDELATAPETLANLKLQDLADHLRQWWQPDQLTTLTVTPIK